MSRLVAEYNQRKMLATLGFFSPLEELPAWKSEAFGIIDAEIHRLQKPPSAKAKKRGK